MALLGNLTGSSQFFNPPTFYNGVATQSLRLNAADNAFVSKTFGSGSQRTWTWSGWVKRSVLGSAYCYTQVTSGSDVSWLYFNASDQLNMQNYEGANQVDIKTNAKFRDISAWYHVMAVLDTTQSTNTDRAKMYVNGELQTSLASTTYPSQNADLKIGSGDAPFIIGGTPDSYGTGAGYKFDGYFAEVNFVDGTALDPTYFGETKDGVWIPKKYTGSYGTNGFRLEFKQTGTGTASASTIGADTSGEGNHLTSTNVVASDCAMPDSPENNFCTLNPNARGTTNVSTANGNLYFVKSSANFGNIFSTFPLYSGKWYFEGRNHGSALTQIGVQEVTNNIYTASGDFGPNTDLGMWDSRGYYYDEGTAGGSPPTYTTGDIIGVAFDVDAGKIWFSKNGTYNHSGDPANGTNQTTGSTNDLSSIGVTPAGNGENGGGFDMNFGQDSSFAGNETAQGNTDGNGIGDFYYAPPSGFLAICSANLPKPTIGPDSATQADDYFNTVLWTGNGSTQSITSVGFQPDWVWIKDRGATNWHDLTDSSRGATKSLFTNVNNAETTATNSLTAFTSNGYNLGDNGQVNGNTNTYVGWNWKANGGTTTTNDASATGVGSIDSVYQANTTAGFSIVTYTGSSSGTDGTPSTIAHGLGAVPKWILFLPRDQYDGCVYHGSNTTAPATDRLILKASQSSDAAGATSDDSLFFNDTEPTSTVFSVGTRKHANSNGGMVAYCFADVEGYSKFGGFVGNGNADGAFVYTGFRPAWILIKNTARSADWRLHDIARQPTNDSGGHILLPNSNSAEVTNEYDMDFLSNGFKMRTSSVYAQGSGETVIYMAFAEAPFKYANAR